jgi:ribosomal protein S18 acetylase RimI-like enzyme
VPRSDGGRGTPAGRRPEAIEVRPSSVAVGEGEPVTEATVDVAGWDEVDVVRELRLAALADAPDAFWATLDDERDQPGTWWRARVVGDVRWLVGRLGGEPVGLAAVGPDRLERERVVNLTSFWVAPQARGRGLGDALIDAAIVVARELGAGSVTLEVGDHNAAAIATYERHGFARTERTGRFLPPRDHITEHERIRQLDAQG